ncbi:MAG: hypothetical protein ACW99Q_26730, partial [Candidatus Kariarchaeaceae archaeon]
QNNFGENMGTSYIVEKNDKPIGFFTLSSIRFSKYPDLFLISNMSSEAVNQIIHYITNNFETDGTLCLNISETMDIFDKISKLNLKPKSGWKWQIKIINLAGFISSIKSTIEKRLTGSKYSNLEDVLIISNYKKKVTISFQNGKIEYIGSELIYPDQTASLRIPPNVVPVYLLGDKSYNEIREIVPDILMNSKYKELLEILFPKLNSFPIYWY